MIDSKGTNMWSRWREGHWIVIPIYGFGGKDDGVVMTRGLSKIAKLMYPELPIRINRLKPDFGVDLMAWDDYKIITFPVKNRWQSKSCVPIIIKSARGLAETRDKILKDQTIYLPKIEVKESKVYWNRIRKILAKELDDNFIVCLD